MNVEDRGASIRLAWLAALAVGVAALVAESQFPPLRPFVAPLICAAAIGIRLPKRHFFLLSALLAATILLDPWAAWGQTFDFAQRMIAVACLGLLVICKSCRWPVGPFLRRWDRAQTGIPKVVMSAPSTVIHLTEHHSAGQADGEFSIGADLSNDAIYSALARLSQASNFDARQMRLIEAELRLVEGQHAGIHQAINLKTGVHVGRFAIDEPLGRGGEGNVYRGHDESGRVAAIKILHNVKASERFRREMHLVRKLAHPNIVTAYEVGEISGIPYMAMELLSGPDLHMFVREAGPLDWQIATQYCLQAARACAHAHRRDLIHRDIKPGNLILNGDDCIKVVDFGLASLLRSDAAMDSVFRMETKEGHMAGTLPFMAPEQARSLANATVRSDIYSLGTSWFYLLTGKERLQGRSFAEQFENLLVRRRFNSLPSDCMPRSLQRIFRRMTAYKVDDRYESCDQLVFDLERALEKAGEVTAPDQINVLVVEDSRVDMMYTIEMLRRSNSTLLIHQAPTLADGLDACRLGSIDLVILDLQLPDSKGVDTVTRFRRFNPTVPLVVLTGSSAEEVSADCLAAGADTFVSKSGISPHRMERTIFVTLSRRGLSGAGDFKN